MSLVLTFGSTLMSPRFKISTNEPSTSGEGHRELKLQMNFMMWFQMNGITTLKDQEREQTQVTFQNDILTLCLMPETERTRKQKLNSNYKVWFS